MLNEESTQGNFDKPRFMDYRDNIKRIANYKACLLYMTYYR